MRNEKIKFVIFQLLTILLTGLVIWIAAIEPKNTRLRLYEILAETKNSKAGDIDQTKLISSLLRDLNQMDPKHFRPCEKIHFYNRKAKLKRFADQPGQTLTSLETAAWLYSQNTLTLEQLSQIGEAEFEKVTSELDLFETEYRNAGGNYSLNELAQQPENLSSDPNEIEDIYNTHIAKAEDSLAPRFYDYDIPKGTTRVIRRGHPYSAYASYRERANLLVTYFDQATYDISIAPFISVHEIFPGHHLNMKSRASDYICSGNDTKSAGWLVEGWATYAEFIADEEGIFNEAEHKLAWLDYRLTRAMRIILDVKRMQPETNYDDLKMVWEQRMPVRLHHRFAPELNRLVKSNHQHLSYILGHQAILRTKAKLMQDFGDKFDEKAFHDAMLRLEHKYPEALYETAKIAMETPELRAGKDTVSVN